MKIVYRLDAFDSGAYSDHFHALVNCDIAIANGSVEVTSISFNGRECVRQIDETQPCVWQRTKVQNNQHIHWFYMYYRGCIYRRRVGVGLWDVNNTDDCWIIPSHITDDTLNIVLASLLLGVSIAK